MGYIEQPKETDKIEITMESSIDLEQTTTLELSDEADTRLQLFVPLYEDHHLIQENLQKAKIYLSNQTKDSYTLQIDGVPQIEYKQKLFELGAAGNLYDLIYLQEQTYKEFFLPKEYVEKGLLLDITEILPRAYPQGLVYVNLMGNTKTKDNQIFAVPRVYAQQQVYGLLCKNTFVDPTKEMLVGYQETINFLKERSSYEDIKMMFSWEDFLNMYIADSVYTQIIPSVVLNRETKKLSYIQDTKFYHQVAEEYEMLSVDLEHNSPDVILGDIDTFHIWGHTNSAFAQNEEYSLLCIQSQNTPLVQYETVGAFGVGAGSQKAEESLMLLSYLDLVESNKKGLSSWMDHEIIPGLLGSDVIALQNQTPEELQNGNSKELLDWLCERLNLPLPNRQVSLVMVGDVLLHTPVNESGKYPDGSYNYDHLFQHVKEEVEAADVAVINQEVILGGRELGLSGYPVFNGAFEVGDAIAKAGFDVVLHATNHTLDKGAKGVLNTLKFWNESYPEIHVAGINKSQEDQENRIIVTTINDIKIALLNFTYDTNGIKPPGDMPYLVNYQNRKFMEGQIKKAKEMADFVIVFPHWGIEYQTKPSSDQKNLAKFFADLEVDLVLGSHPHVIEPMEWVEGVKGNKTLVYYSLGNFVNATSGTGEGVYKRMVGAMACVTIEKGSDGNSFVASNEAKPLVTHVKSGTAGITVYYLNDYTADLASENNIVLQDKDFSYELCKDLWEEVMDP